MNNLLSSINAVKGVFEMMRETIKICFMGNKIGHKVPLAILLEVHLQHLVVHSERDSGIVGIIEYDFMPSSTIVTDTGEIEGGVITDHTILVGGHHPVGYEDADPFTVFEEGE